MTLLAPSIMAGNHINFQLELSEITSYADIVHLDIMDGHFVPNLGLGIKTCADICKESTIPCYAHLMVRNPDDYIQKFGVMGAKAFVWHIETKIDHKKMISEVKKMGMKAGLAISPNTKLSELKKFSELVDMVTVMGVVPGRSGQSFIPDTVERVRLTRELSANFKIEVDGGVDLENAEKLVYAGADILVSGSSFFRSDKKNEFANRIHSLKRS